MADSSTGPSFASSESPPPSLHTTLGAAGLLTGVCALYFLSRFNYLLFHSLVELSSVVVAITTFSIGWNARKISRNDSFTLLAIAFLAVGLLDLFHTLTYKGMGVFPGVGVDVPTQFWIAARSLQAGAFLASGWLLAKNRNTGSLDWAGGFLAAGILLALAIWPWKIFPSCLSDQGLTPFKIGAEYVICAVLAFSAWLYWRGRPFLDRKTIHLLLLSIGAAILAEFSFTLYQDVYGLANCAGHLFKVVSVFLAYKALVQGALRDPYQSLFRDLTLSHRELNFELENRRLVEEKLRNANSELDAFVRTAAHDLRSPLTVFISGTELLRRFHQGEISRPQLEVLEGMEQKAWEMSRLLEDLLQLARIGHVQKPVEEVDATKIARRAIADHQELILASGTRVTLETEELPRFYAHSTFIYQIFSNLIGNAVRYAGGPGQPIQVGGSRIGSKVRFSVRDHGPGISEEEKKRLGEIFYRGENARDHQGNGIGLAIVKKITHHYMGRFWIEDTPGGGSTFWVELQEQAINTNIDSTPQNPSLCGP